MRSYHFEIVISKNHVDFNDRDKSMLGIWLHFHMATKGCRLVSKGTVVHHPVVPNMF